MVRSYPLHLVSDATGATLNTFAKAVCAQFEDAVPRTYLHTLVRSERQLRKVVDQIAANPGMVFFTLVNPHLHQILETECGKLNITCVSILDSAVHALGKFLGAEESHRPGGQHEVDSEYLDRIEAMNFAIQHDDGQATQNLGKADVVLVGASRTSKTPTCIYLALQGIRAANVPIVPGAELPAQLTAPDAPFIVGLWAAPERLLQVRRNRLNTIGETKTSDYVDEESVRGEISATRKLYERHGWPAIDVSRRSIEETAAAVINLMNDRRPAS